VVCFPVFLADTVADFFKFFIDGVFLCAGAAFFAVD
jgi:hypothetical protein